MSSGPIRDLLRAYANGWYGGNNTPAEYAKRAIDVIKRSYTGLKVDPFGAAWQTLSESQSGSAVAIVAAIRDAIGPDVDIMIEVHGRLNADTAIKVAEQLEPFRPAWYEEPVVPNDFDGLAKVRDAISFPVATGERLYSYHEFERLIDGGSVDVVQMDANHCGGLAMSRRIAQLAVSAPAAAHNSSARANTASGGSGLVVSPHCSIGPVALAAKATSISRIHPVSG